MSDGFVVPCVERSGMATRVSDKPSRTPTKQAPTRITTENTVSLIRAFSFPLGRFVVLSALYCRGTVGMSMKHLYQVVGERAGKLDLPK
jgi:hypothetical protein